MSILAVVMVRGLLFGVRRTVPFTRCLLRLKFRALPLYMGAAAAAHLA